MVEFVVTVNSKLTYDDILGRNSMPHLNSSIGASIFVYDEELLAERNMCLYLYDPRSSLLFLNFQRPRALEIAR